MPLTRVSLIKGKPVAYRTAILDGLYRAMRATFGVPENWSFGHGLAQYANVTPKSAEA